MLTLASWSMQCVTLLLPVVVLFYIYTFSFFVCLFFPHCLHTHWKCIKRLCVVARALEVLVRVIDCSAARGTSSFSLKQPRYKQSRDFSRPHHLDLLTWMNFLIWFAVRYFSTTATWGKIKGSPTWFVLRIVGEEMGQQRTKSRWGDSAMRLQGVRELKALPLETESDCAQCIFLLLFLEQEQIPFPLTERMNDPNLQKERTGWRPAESHSSWSLQFLLWQTADTHSSVFFGGFAIVLPIPAVCGRGFTPRKFTSHFKMLSAVVMRMMMLTLTILAARAILLFYDTTMLTIFTK